MRLARGRRNPIVAWLDELGLFGLRSHEKFVPADVFGLSDEQLALFLRHLWATDGCVHIDRRNNDNVRVYYASTSKRLADDVARLLTRFGIAARIKTTHKAGYRDSYHVHVVGCEQQAAFFRRIGCHGARGDIAERALRIVEKLSPNTNVDTIPPNVWTRVRDILAEQKVTHRRVRGRDVDPVLRFSHVEARAEPRAPRTCCSCPRRRRPRHACHQRRVLGRSSVASTAR